MRTSEIISRFDKVTKTSTGWMVRCPAHKDTTPSLSISTGDKGETLINCFAGCLPESVCSAMGIGIKDLFDDDGQQTSGNGHYSHDSTTKAPFVMNGSAKAQKPKTEASKHDIEAVYPYHDLRGREVYQVVRLKPKSFRQRHKVGTDWVWNMQGVERVLYRLPDVAKAETVWITEGEKDADNLAKLGFCATCNVGGAGKWLDSYSETVKGKHVVLCGDTDKPGREHVELVSDAIEKVAKSVRVVQIPDPHKDASDFIATFGTQDEARHALELLLAKSEPLIAGSRLPVYSMADLEARYAAQVRDKSRVTLNLADWLPSLRKVRPLTPGDLVLILGATGTGKTAILQNIAMSAAKAMPTVFFQMEITGELLFERFLASRTKRTCAEVEEAYIDGGSELHGREFLDSAFPNLFICPESKLTIDRVEEIINRAELKMGTRPTLALIDYCQLVGGKGSSRYERMSDIGEGLKRLAKATNCIVVVSSQIGRPKDDKSEGNQVSLHSAKDSGALENSAGLVLGAWRDGKDPTALHMAVLKATKGGSGTQVVCNFDGARMLITERATSVGLPTNFD